MTPLPTIEIDVLLEFRDYLRANYWIVLHRYKLLLVLFFIAAMYSLLYVWKSSQGPVENSWRLFIPWVVLALLLIGTYFNTKKSMASNKALSEPVHYVFSEDGLATSAASFSGTTAWKNIYEAQETKSSFLIFVSKSMMYIIPKRCFDSVEQIESFKRLLRSQLSKAKLKW